MAKTMQGLYEVRRRRLQEFLDRHDTDREAATMLGIAPGFLSQLKMNPSNPRAKNIGEQLARSMEQAASLRPGWFDDLTRDSLTAQEQALLRRFRNVDPETQQEVLGFLALKRSMQFSGDPERRDEFQEKITAKE